MHLLHRSLLTPLLIGCALGASSSAAPQLIREHLGGGTNHFLGQDVAFIGDMDGDGVDDYAIVGRDASLGSTPPPVAVRSGATGAFVQAFGVASGAGPLARIERVGDVDGDGVPDLGVGGTNSVGVISGATDARLWTYTSPPSPTLVLWGFAAVGDVDLDGVTDLAATGEYQFSGLGRTLVLSGFDGQILWDNGVEGRSLARIGDANGDGLDDLVVGDSSYTAAGVAANLGRALVLDGTTGSLIRIHRTDPVASGQMYGSSVCRVDDVDGDGVDDFAVAASATGRSSSYPAWIDLWSSATGQHIRRISRVGDNGLGGGPNGSLVNAGDLDGDGVGDVIAGNEGTTINQPTHDFIRAFSGATGRTIAIATGVGGAGHSIAFGSDVDGDGQPDVIFGSPYTSWSGVAAESNEGHVMLARLLPVADAVARFCVAEPNSTGLAGRIDWSGSTSVAADDFVLQATQLPPSTFGLFVFESAFFFNNPVGNGRLCITDVRRIQVVAPTGTGSVAFPVPSSLLSEGPFQPLQSGDTRAFQFWCRDSVGAGSNLTDAIVVDFRD